MDPTTPSKGVVKISVNHSPDGFSIAVKFPKGVDEAERKKQAIALINSDHFTTSMDLGKSFDMQVQV